eukprot:1981552-Pyramimonas_sp.AAC.1
MATHTHESCDHASGVAGGAPGQRCPQLVAPFCSPLGSGPREGRPGGRGGPLCISWRRLGPRAFAAPAALWASRG